MLAELGVCKLARRREKSTVELSLLNKIRKPMTDWFDIGII